MLEELIPPVPCPRPGERRRGPGRSGHRPRRSGPHAIRILAHRPWPAATSRWLPGLLNLDAFLRHGQRLVVLAGILRALARSPIVAERSRSSVVALAWSGVASKVSQGWPPAFFTSASQRPMASRRKGIAWAEHRSRPAFGPMPNRQRQLERGIELRGVAEALDEGLDLLHGRFRVAL